MSAGWSIFIIAMVLINVAGSLWLLQLLSKGRRQTETTETTGHVWDGDLRELNNPLPRWWLWLFWLTAFFLLIYLVIYPGMGSLSGTLGWTQQAQYEQEVTAANERYGDIYGAFADVPLADLPADPEAVRLGRNLYMNNCATCHGSDGRGARGFPNLTDGEWLYGGQPEVVQATIANGRIGVMPALGAALGEGGTEAVTAYVLSLSGASADASLVQEGEAKYRQFCVACHGLDGKGNPALGGPNLTNDIWLHGSDAETIADVINAGRVNQMPAQQDLLTDDQIRTLVAYVLSLQDRSGTE